MMKFFQTKMLICLATIVCSSGAEPAAYGQSTSSATGAIAPVVLRGHHSGVTAVQYSPDGAWLASSSLDGTVRLWSTRTWKVARILNHGSEIYAIAFSPNGHLLISGGYDHRLMFWETKSGALRRAVKFPDWLVGIAFTPTGQLIAGCSDGVVRLLNPSTGAINRTVNTGHEMVSFAVSGDGRYLATGLPIKLWDLASGKRLSQDMAGLGQNGLAFTPSDDRLASAEGTGGVLVSSVANGERRDLLRIEAEKKRLGPSGYTSFNVNMPASAVAISRDGTWLAAGGSDFGVHLWRVTSEAIDKASARVLSGHLMTVTGVSFSPDGSRLASASLDRTIRVWELR